MSTQTLLCQPVTVLLPLGWSASFWLIVLAFCVCVHASHYHLCAVACVYSIFINSYFYSKPCWFQSFVSKSWLQPKYQWEEQWENRQLWKGTASLPNLLSMVGVSNLLVLLKSCWFFNSQIPRPLSLIGSTLRFDKLDQAETRSLLMCFLHIMKTISEGKESPLKLIKFFL